MKCMKKQTGWKWSWPSAKRSWDVREVGGQADEEVNLISCLVARVDLASLPEDPHASVPTYVTLVSVSVPFITSRDFCTGDTNCHLIMNCHFSLWIVVIVNPFSQERSSSPSWWCCWWWGCPCSSSSSPSDKSSGSELPGLGIRWRIQLPIFFFVKHWACFRFTRPLVGSVTVQRWSPASSAATTMLSSPGASSTSGPPWMWVGNFYLWSEWERLKQNNQEQFDGWLSSTPVHQFHQTFSCEKIHKWSHMVL